MVRLQQLIEAVDVNLDPIYTADTDKDTLCRIIFMTTGTKPNTPCRNLRVKKYKELCARMRTAGQRIASNMGAEQYSKMISEILATKDHRTMAQERGFNESWLVIQKVEKRKQDPATGGGG